MSNTDDPATNSDAARNKAAADARNGSWQADTSTWTSSSRESYQREWDHNKNGN